jgi:toxin ParE1/3/4
MDLPEFHRLAERELNEAAQYYDTEEPGLGSSFLREVDRCLQSIQAHPEAGPILRGDVRRRLIRRFPYALLYKIKPAGVRILAVMNSKRRPTYWVGRE